MTDMMWCLKLSDDTAVDDQYVSAKLSKYESGDTIYLRKSREVLTHSSSIADALAQELCDLPYEITIRSFEWEPRNIVAELAAYDAETDRLIVLETMQMPEHLS